MGGVMALHVESIVLHAFLLCMCLLYVNLGLIVIPSILGFMFMGSVVLSYTHSLVCGGGGGVRSSRF